MYTLKVAFASILIVDKVGMCTAHNLLSCCHSMIWTICFDNNIIGDEYDLADLTNSAQPLLCQPGSMRVLYH